MGHILVRGNEFLFTRKLNELKEGVVDPAVRDFNFDQFSLKEKGASYFIDLAATLPVMSPARLIIADDLDKLNESDAQRLALALPRFPDSSKYILICKKLDRRTSLAKALIKHAEIHEFKDPYPNEIPDWIIRLAREKKLKLSRDVAQQMADVIGADLMQAERELEKLSLYMLPRTEVASADVDALVSRGLMRNVFALNEFIASRKIDEAQSLFNEMVEQGESLHRILGLVVMHFRKLLLLVEHVQDHLSRPDPTRLAPLLGVPAFFIKDYVRQVQSLGQKKLRSIYRDLLQISMQLRSTGWRDETIFGAFLMRTCLAS